MQSLTDLMQGLQDRYGALYHLGGLLLAVGSGILLVRTFNSEVLRDQTRRLYALRATRDTLHAAIRDLKKAARRRRPVRSHGPLEALTCGAVSPSKSKKRRTSRFSALRLAVIAKKADS